MDELKITGVALATTPISFSRWKLVRRYDHWRGRRRMARERARYGLRPDQHVVPIDVYNRVNG